MAVKISSKHKSFILKRLENFNILMLKNKASKTFIFSSEKAILISLYL